MNSKKTDDLRTALKNATGIESFLNDNAEAFTNPNDLPEKDFQSSRFKESRNE